MSIDGTLHKYHRINDKYVLKLVNIDNISHPVKIASSNTNSLVLTDDGKVHILDHNNTITWLMHTVKKFNNIVDIYANTDSYLLVDINKTAYIIYYTGDLLSTLYIGKYNKIILCDRSILLQTQCNKIVRYGYDGLYREITKYKDIVDFANGKSYYNKINLFIIIINESSDILKEKLI